MAEKEVHVTGGNGVGSGLVAGILVAAIIALGFVFFMGGFNFDGGKDINVNLQTPKVDAPKPKGD